MRCVLNALALSFDFQLLLMSIMVTLHFRCLGRLYDDVSSVRGSELFASRMRSVR